MSQPFLIAFREALQCSIILVLMLAYLKTKDDSEYHKSFISGIVIAFIIGFIAGYVPLFSRLWGNKTWTFWRYTTELIIFYSSILFLISKSNPSKPVVKAGLMLLGFSVFFFEARASGFLIYDYGMMKENITGITIAGLTGIISGFIPVLLLNRFLEKIPIHKALTLPSLLMLTGALKFAFGGAGELEEGNILIALQKGLLGFFKDTTEYMQGVLLLSEHPFIEVPFAALARFLSGDRMATSAMVIFTMLPPLLILSHLFAKPEPIVSDIQVRAERRLNIAFFRKELIYKTTPVLLSFVILLVLIHAVNMAVNPLYGPEPIPVREAEGLGVLKIPLSDQVGDLTDGKLRKYVYYYGDKQIIFLAILKPDGSLGVALDQCEICKPAEWNKAAQGYAQRGDHLVCKYCMTPIPIPTINNPGGCNPIPLPFKLEDNYIIISLDDLIRTYKNAEALDKKGTHL